jgi:hypothetical protein
MGLRYQELNGNFIQFAQLGFQTEFWPNIFLLLRANIGNAFEQWETDFSNNSYISGIGITGGTELPLGPLEFTIMTGDLPPKK